MVTRSELDMLDIREIFRTKYEKSLYSMIKVSGPEGGREGSKGLSAEMGWGATSGRAASVQKAGSLLGTPGVLAWWYQQGQSGVGGAWER